jgi:PKHD-type hydroxylase
LQLPEDSKAAPQLRLLVLTILSQNALFFTAVRPKKIYPPLFNNYSGATNSFGNHVDNVVRTHPGSAQHVRTDLSFTLFLSEPDEYVGGKLVLEEGLQGQRVKLPTGDLILYPYYSVHRVESVTQGIRLARFSWLQSMVRDPQQRTLLFDLDMSILQLRQHYGETAEAVNLTSCYHSLLRMWAYV